MKDQNSLKYLDQMIIEISERLRSLPPVPSVQSQQIHRGRMALDDDSSGEDDAEDTEAETEIEVEMLGRRGVRNFWLSMVAQELEELGINDEARTNTSTSGSEKEVMSLSFDEVEEEEDDDHGKL